MKTQVNSVKDGELCPQGFIRMISQLSRGEGRPERKQSRQETLIWPRGLRERITQSLRRGGGSSGSFKGGALGPPERTLYGPTTRQLKPTRALYVTGLVRPTQTLTYHGPSESPCRQHTTQKRRSCRPTKDHFTHHTLLLYPSYTSLPPRGNQSATRAAQPSLPIKAAPLNTRQIGACTRRGLNLSTHRLKSRPVPQA